MYVEPEERDVEARLEEAFGLPEGESPFRVVSPSPSATLQLNAPDGPAVGSWVWGKVLRVDLPHRPTALRRFAIWAITGARWVDRVVDTGSSC